MNTEQSVMFETKEDFLAHMRAESKDFNLADREMVQYLLIQIAGLHAEVVRLKADTGVGTGRTDLATGVKATT